MDDIQEEILALRTIIYVREVDIKNAKSEIKRLKKDLEDLLNAQEV